MAEAESGGTWPMPLVIKVPVGGGAPELGELYWNQKEAEHMLTWYHGEPTEIDYTKYWVERDIQRRPVKVLHLAYVELQQRRIT